MAGNGDDDEFGTDDFDDDAFDDLPLQKLQALERDATVASQQPAFVNPSYKPQKVLTRSVDQKPPIPLSNVQDGAGIPYNGTQTQHDQEEIVNLDDFHVVPRPAYTNNHGNQPANSLWMKSLVHRANQSSQPTPSQPFNGTQSGAAPDLRSVVQRLEREKLALKQTLEATTQRAQAKSGEVAILRQKLDQTTREYDQKIEHLKAAQLETSNKSKAEVEALKKEREKLQIDKQFLEHDMAVGVGRSRQNTRLDRVALSSRISGQKNAVTASPSRSERIPLGDGFDDDEVQFVSPSKRKGSLANRAPPLNKSFDDARALSSPSKSRGPSAPATPSHRPEKKRKRMAHSPANQAELPLAEATKVPSPWQANTPYSEGVDMRYEHRMPRDSKAGERLRFVQQILNFRLPGSEDRLLEVLGQHSLPSDPTRKLSKVLLDKLTIREVDESDTALSFVIGLSELWASVLREKYHGVLNLIVRLALFILGSKRYSFIKSVVDCILPLAMETVHLIAYPISAKLYNKSQGIKDTLIPPPELDINACFDLLLLISSACQASPNHLESYWKTVNLHWILYLLMEAQPIHHVIFACDLLQTSARPATFGPIFSEEDTSIVQNQDESEALLVERLTQLLSQAPSPVTDTDPPLDLDTLLSFRLNILKTLHSMALPPRAGIALAKHPLGMGRLIHFLYTVTDSLYSPSTSPEDTHELAIACINQSVRLLYHLLTTQESHINLREKLKTVKGGAHIHLIALTRIAFCEGIVLERGIEQTVSDAAHALLDEFLSPVEGDQLLRMFTPAGSTNFSVPPGQGEDREEEDADMGAEEEVIDLLTGDADGDVKMENND
jgi:DNA damage checkpoint Rad26-like protein/DNA damage checkpoint protein